MALSKEQKQKILSELKEKITRQKTMVFVDFSGLKVKDMSTLRKKLKVASNEIKVTKKTLFQLAFKEGKIKADIEALEGEIALVFGYEDQISAPKTVYNFSKENPNLKILGGYFENDLISSEKVIELAQIPTREELLARLVGSVSAPAYNFINVLESNLKGLVFALSAIKK